MAINIPIITEFSDKGLQSAQGAFGTFRSKVAEAEGGMGKFKAGAGVAMDSVKANAGIMAVAAGGAIAGFALKAIGDFQDLALSVDEFRNKTDLTLDQSSKWVSYTGDLGIEADAMTKIFSRLAKAATDEIPAFEELGVAIAFGPDGSTDIEETFLRVNDAINSLDDPVAEAAYRADLYGKGWMTAAELVQMGSDDIRTALDGVKDFEVIDETEIEKAKDLRAAQDELGDAMARLSVKLGEVLLPVLEDMLTLLIPILEALGKFSGTLDDGLAKAIEKAEDMGKSMSDIARELGANDEKSLNYMASVLGITLDQLYQQLDSDLIPETYFLEQAWIEGSRAMIDAHDAGDDLTESLISVDDALAELKGEVDERQAWRNLQDEFDRTLEKAVEAFTEGTPEALRDSERALDDLRVEVGEYIAEVDGIPTDKKTEFIANLENANIQDIENTLNYLARNRVSYIDVIERAREQAGTGSGMGSGRTGVSAFSLRPASSGVTVNVAGSVISENDLVETVRKGLVNAQRSGKGLVYSNS